MILRLEPSRSGIPTLMAGNIYVHSRYDPISEVERFVQSINIPHRCEVIIILEPGLGYCIPFFKNAYPTCKVLIIHASTEIKDIPECVDRLADSVWFPDQGIDLITFLEQEIPEGSCSQLIEWKPSAKAYGHTYQILLRRIQQFLDREAANIRTTVGFGKRWLKNTCKNFALLQNPLVVKAGQIPVIVTGAGPSLEDTIPLLHKALAQGPLCIVAAASSVPALLAHGIVPSISVATDGGTWAAFHLIDQFRRAGQLVHSPSQRAKFTSSQHITPEWEDRPLPFPLAVTLNAQVCSQAAQVPQLVISDGSLWQTRLLQKLEIPYMQLPQRGTVSATIIDLAMLLSTGPIYITGMDMAHRDIRTHARPYGLDFYTEAQANRFTPLYSLRFKRALIDANHGALSMYADWFAWYFSDKIDRVAVLGEKHPRFPMLPAVTTIHWNSYEAPSLYVVPRKTRDVYQSKYDYVSLLIQELQSSSEQGLMQEELSFLLSGNKKALSVSEIITNLSALFS